MTQRTTSPPAAARQHRRWRPLQRLWRRPARTSRPHLRLVPPPGPEPRPRPVVEALLAIAAGLAASVFTGAIAAGVAGFEASRDLRPVEFAIRVGLILAAPCVAALLATFVLPRRLGQAPPWAVGVGVALGPVLVLRLDRILAYGVLPTLAVLAVLVVWAVVGGLLASGTGRPAPPREHETPRPVDDRSGRPGRSA